MQTRATVDWQAREGLAEYRTAGGALRGFCGRCGSSLWFRDAAGGFSVEAGCVDGPTGGRLAAHIFVAEKGSHYDIDGRTAPIQRLGLTRAPFVLALIPSGGERGRNAPHSPRRRLRCRWQRG